MKKVKAGKKQLKRYKIRLYRQNQYCQTHHRNDKSGPETTKQIMAQENKTREYDNSVLCCAGFRIGDKIIVSAKRLTYHGWRGTVKSFCSNGSKSMIYVLFNGKNQHRLYVSSLSHAAENSTRSIGSKSSRVPTTITNGVLVDPIVTMTMVATVNDEISVASTMASARSRRDCVLSLFETIETMHCQNRDNKNLMHQLSVLQCKILLLTLRR